METIVRSAQTERQVHWRTAAGEQRVSGAARRMEAITDGKTTRRRINGTLARTVLPELRGGVWIQRSGAHLPLRIGNMVEAFIKRTLERS